MSVDIQPPWVARVGAIGDIHQEDVVLEQVLQYMKPLGLDAVLAVGDVVDGPGDGARCCDLLKAHDVDVVRGNHDRWFLKDALRADGTAALPPSAREYIESLPSTRVYETAKGRLLLCHGLAENDMNRLCEEDQGYALQSNDELQELLATQEFRFVVNGHSHRRMVRDFGGVTVINVGTLFREHAPCFGILDFEKGVATFYDVLPDSSGFRVASEHSL